MLRNLVHVVVLAALSSFLYAQPQLKTDWIPAEGGIGQGEYLAICIIVKNQLSAVQEFMQYHRSIGVQKFYVYDHGSEEPIADVLREHMQAGVVEYTYFSGHHMLPARNRFSTTAQGYAYDDCIRRARHRHRWLAFLDADEFLIIHDSDPNKQDINAFMRDYESHGGLAVNWMIFGSSGHEKQPFGPSLAEYTQCIPLNHKMNRHIKTIANTQFLQGIGKDPHAFTYVPGASAVNELFQPVNGPFSGTASQTRIAVYHYVLKSRAEFQQKMQRGGGSGSMKKMNFFNAINRLATETCNMGVGKGLRCCKK